MRDQSKPRIWLGGGRWHCAAPDMTGLWGHGNTPAEAWQDRQRTMDEAGSDVTWLSIVRMAYLAQFAPVGRPS